MGRIHSFSLKIFPTVVITVLLGGIFVFNTSQNLAHQDYRTSNFFTFWLSSHMMWTGESPYNESQWLGAHDLYGITWRPNRIFPYPLPLALFMAPLGFLPLKEAFILWSLASQVILASAIYFLLNHRQDPAQRRLFLPLVIASLFFGPIYLALKVGTVSILGLGIMLTAILLLEKGKWTHAGIVLALLMLKPPQGLPILILAGFWFLFHRNWKAIAGVVIGGLSLLVISFVLDLHWLSKFQTASQAVLDRTLGIHSNVWTFAFFACQGNWSCTTALGGLGALVLLGGGCHYLYRHRNSLTHWEAFNLIIPLGFVSTIYLWNYDQALYIIPITWIAASLSKKTRSYLWTFVFLILLDIWTFFLLYQQALTKKDIWNVSTTAVVLGMCMWLLWRREKSDYKPSPAFQ